MGNLRSFSLSKVKPTPVLLVGGRFRLRRFGHRPRALVGEGEGLAVLTLLTPQGYQPLPLDHS